MALLMDYANQGLTLQQLRTEREVQLKRISASRGDRDVLVIAADLSKGLVQNLGIDYGDLVVIRDQIQGLSHKCLDLIVETPGGAGEVAEDIVTLLRSKYEHISVIVPGWAKSAGTIIAMAGDEILMEAGSALGPIDAQLQWSGKVFSADALLEGLNKIKDEVDQKKSLNKAYIPILQGISPGEIQHAENAQSFSKTLVTEWLIKYKFKDWTTHQTKGKPSFGKPVTDAEKRARAEEIANKLGNHTLWRTHARSIKISDLNGMGLRVTDYSAEPELADAINRYYTLLHLTFQSTVYKIIETQHSWISRQVVPAMPVVQPVPAKQEVPKFLPVEIYCVKCHEKFIFQWNLDPAHAVQAGMTIFPASGYFKCSKCNTNNKVDQIQSQLDIRIKKQNEQLGIAKS